MKEIICNTQRDNQHMTSLEIAQVTGKQHKDVLKAIRNMEPAWEKTCGRKFALTSRTVVQPNGGTRDVACFSLSKMECLYIATKFNDEARAKLVIRWEELEWEQLKVKSEKFAAAQTTVLCLPTPEDVLNEADAILGEELDELNRRSDCCFTPTEIGRLFGIEGRDLNSFLADHNVIRWDGGQWRLTPRYENQGLAENRCFYYHGRNGRRKMESRLVWTEKGRKFVIGIIKK